MKKSTFLNLALSLSCFGLTTLPTVANPNMFYTPVVNSGITVPQSTAIVVGFPQNFEMNIKQKVSPSLTLPLAQPITDSSGNVLVPQGTPITVEIVPNKKEKSAYIVAKSIVVGGKVISLQASSSKIASVKVKVKTGKQQAQENRNVFGNLGGNIAVGLTNNSNETATDTTKDGTTGAAIGNTVGIITGLLSAEKINLIQIPQGSLQVLTLETPITLPNTIASRSTKIDRVSSQEINQSTSNDLASQLENWGNQQVVNNPSMYSVDGQPISTEIKGKLQALLGRHGISEASCNANTQQVQIIVEDKYVVCGNPTQQHPEGKYRLTFK